jgi:hypothetical protein
MQRRIEVFDERGAFTLLRGMNVNKKRVGWILLWGIAVGLHASPGLAAEAPADPCANVQLAADKITADLTKLDGPDLDTLRENLFGVVPSGFARGNDLVSVGRLLASSAAHSGITTATALAPKLSTGMKQACTTLNGSKTATVEDAFAAALGVSNLPAPPSSQYLFFLGSVNSLQAQGGFTSNVEASFLSRTPFVGAHQPKGSNHSEMTLDGVLELTYAKIGAVSTAQSPASGSTPSTPSTPAQNATANPFTSASGILRANASLESTLVGGYFGVVGGVGFTSRTNSTTDTEARLSPRYFAGVLLLADYGAADGQNHATGRVVLAYARDRFWQASDATDTASPNQPNRVVLDARLDSPGVFKSKSVKFSFQIFADAPMASHGPADVRFSLLISTDIQSLLGIT